MPFTSEQISYGGKAAIDFYQKNSPIDQINTDRPLLSKFMAGKKPYAGGLQYVKEQLRYQNDSNFQSYFGAQQVTYNRKRTLQQTQFVWGSFHDGFGLDEDELAQNGITVTDDKSANASGAELVQLTNLLNENVETLNLGFQENFDIMLHRNGTQSATDIPGLDNLIALDPTTSTVVGGLNQNTYTWWRNYADTTLASGTAGDIVNKMEKAWRACIRVGGSKPDFILCGSTFLDKYRIDAGHTVNRQIQGAPGLQKGGVSVDASTSAVYFKGVELIWDPVFSVMDALDAPTIPWESRCYFINTKFINLRPIAGHWMVSRKPPRVYDKYVHYWALTSKAAFTTSKRNSQAVLALAS